MISSRTQVHLYSIYHNYFTEVLHVEIMYFLTTSIYLKGIVLIFKPKVKVPVMFTRTVVSKGLYFESIPVSLTLFLDKIRTINPWKT